MVEGSTNTSSIQNRIVDITTVSAQFVIEDDVVFPNGKAAICGSFGLLVGLILASSATPAAAQFGPVISAAGATNRSMGGASTAAPLSAGGALMWNPATLSGLKRSELEVGAELLFPHAGVASQFGPFSGSTKSEDSVFPLPMIALAYGPENSPFTFGLGAYAVAGFGLNYPGSNIGPNTNPILLQPPFGVGPIYSQYSVMQIAPALVYDVTDELSLSFSPLLDIGSAQLDPSLISAPTAGVYPNGTHSSQSWGAGYSLGAYYRTDVWGFGASYKSQQWFQPYQFNTVSGGVAHGVDFGISLPAIVSVGTSYQGIDRLLLAADLRYLDYNNTSGFGTSGFAPTGALNGVGLQSIFAVALGAQYQVTDAMTVRMGYSWSQNPVTNAQTSANIASPLVIQNMLSAGATYNVTRDFSLSLAYTHAFENSVAGPLVTPVGPVPGYRIQSTASVDMLTVGATVKFGGPR